MDTSYAPMTSGSEYTLEPLLSFTFGCETWHEAGFQTDGSCAEQLPALDLESPLNRYMAGNQSAITISENSIFSQGDPANVVFNIQNGKVN